MQHQPQVEIEHWPLLGTQPPNMHHMLFEVRHQGTGPSLFCGQVRLWVGCGKSGCITKHKNVQGAAYNMQKKFETRIAFEDALFHKIPLLATLQAHYKFALSSCFVCICKCYIIGNWTCFSFYKAFVCFVLNQIHNVFQVVLQMDMQLV